MANNSTKDILRKKALEKRKELFKSGAIDKISNEIVCKILSLDLYKNSKNIALYYPLKGEINLLDLLKSEEKNFYFPKCKKREIEFCHNLSKFEKGEFGIMEPIGSSINPNILDIIFIPALVANKNFHRLGFGKGCYDLFFNKNKSLKAKKIIVIPSLFISDEFKEDEFDFQCDIVLSEKESFAKN